VCRMHSWRARNVQDVRGKFAQKFAHPPTGLSPTADTSFPIESQPAEPSSLKTASTIEHLVSPVLVEEAVFSARVKLTRPGHCQQP
jgi:hypothetical protein